MSQCGDMLPETILRLIDIMASHSRYSPGTIGRWAAGSGDFTPRLRRGHDVTTRRAERVVQWLSDHWPADAEWPDDIPRPEPRRDAA